MGNCNGSIGVMYDQSLRDFKLQQQFRVRVEYSGPPIKVILRKENELTSTSFVATSLLVTEGLAEKMWSSLKHFIKTVLPPLVFSLGFSSHALSKKPQQPTTSNKPDDGKKNGPFTLPCSRRRSIAKIRLKFALFNWKVHRHHGFKNGKYLKSCTSSVKIILP